MALIYLGTAGLSGQALDPVTFAQRLIAAAGGVVLLAGLWTPVIGALVALDEIWIALSLYSPQREETWTHIFLAIVTVSLAMLGPGAWSLDARLFGRKRFDIDRTRGRKSYL